MSRKKVKELAKNYIEQGKPLAWFEALYASVDIENLKDIPWADFAPNPNLIPVIESYLTSKIQHKKALVIGCGLGDDAEYLSKKGYKVDAFDISGSAINFCKERFPESKVNYFTEDLLKFKNKENYDLIFEAYTLQVLPESLRVEAIENIPDILNKKGTLIVVCRGRNDHEDKGNMPFPLTKRELSRFEKTLNCTSFEDYSDDENPPVRRFRIQYTKP